MNRILLSLSLVFFFTGLLPAQKYMTRSGHIWFFSHTVIEDIEAHNYQTSSILDTQKGELVFSILIKGFQFEKALMQEHFNEKYMESAKYPKATFKGKILNLASVNLSKDGSYEVDVLGELNIHGVSKTIETKATLLVEGQKIQATADFPAKIADYKIKIPGIVKDNIAKTIEVHVSMNYSLM